MKYQPYFLIGTLRECCDLSQLWFREFYLELTMGERIQVCWKHSSVNIIIVSNVTFFHLPIVPNRDVPTLDSHRPHPATQGSSHDGVRRYHDNHVV